MRAPGLGPRLSLFSEVSYYFENCTTQQHTELQQIIWNKLLRIHSLSHLSVNDVLVDKLVFKQLYFLLKTNYIIIHNCL